MIEVDILGTGLTWFGKFEDATIRTLAETAVADALADAGVESSEVGMVFFGNAAAGVLSGQEMIRGQVALRHTGLLGKPIVNVENACASSSTAFALAVSAVASGETEIAIAIGAEKLTHPDKERSFAAIGSAVDLLEIDRIMADVHGDQGDPGGGRRSLFMDIYAAEAREYMARTGATVEDFALAAVKSHRHGALNPKAQYRAPVSVEEVLGSRMVSSPLTLLMCSPIGDGAAAVVVGTRQRAARLPGPRVRVRAAVLVSGTDYGPGGLGTVPRAAATAYERAGIAPSDVDVVELHDAAASAELVVTEHLGLCAPGDGAKLLRSGATALGGSCVVNPSGGLLSRGHPIGATGCAQLVELADQLRGRGNGRQVDGARVALAENAGGFLGPDNAATTVTILST